MDTWQCRARLFLIGFKPCCLESWDSSCSSLEGSSSELCCSKDCFLQTGLYLSQVPLW